MKRMISFLLICALTLSLAACGSKKASVSIDVKALYESYEEYLPAMYTPDESTMLNFLGIRTEDCTQCQVALCAEGLRADEVWLIEAKDEAALEKIQKLAQTRIEAKEGETITYVPDQYVIVQKAEVLVNGLYLAFLISPDVEAMKGLFEAAFA